MSVSTKQLVSIQSVYSNRSVAYLILFLYMRQETLPLGTYVSYFLPSLEVATSFYIPYDTQVPSPLLKGQHFIPPSKSTIWMTSHKTSHFWVLSFVILTWQTWTNVDCWTAHSIFVINKMVCNGLWNGVYFVYILSHLWLRTTTAKFISSATKLVYCYFTGLYWQSTGNFNIHAFFFCRSVLI